MKTKTIIMHIAGIAALVVPSSCKKFIDAKPSSIYSTVSSITDTQLILDNSGVINISKAPSYLGEVSADNYYWSQSWYDFVSTYVPASHQQYIWGQYPFLNTNSPFTDWAISYSSIMIFNTALDALDKIKLDDSNKLAYNNAKGCALAFRGYFFWKLATIFSKTYRAESASSDLGIPLRLNININETSTRATVQQTYEQVIKDLTEAATLLPEKPSVITRPSKSSAYAMLAEVYLSMRNYDQALNYAEASLKIKNDLIDYNTLNASSTVPIPAPTINPEILIYSSGTGAFGTSSMLVNPVLLDSYQANDLRQKFFYKANLDGTYYFLNPYSLNANAVPFTGPTTAEMYLTRAECLARKSDVPGALADLNTLLKKRILSASYVPYTASSSADALQLILNERRKELAFRDLRWMDLKRLNAEGANITLTRNVSGKIYTLLPNDNRYALQLPTDVIQISGMQQNPYP